MRAGDAPLLDVNHGAPELEHASETEQRSMAARVMTGSGLPAHNAPDDKDLPTHVRHDALHHVVEVPTTSVPPWATEAVSSSSSARTSPERASTSASSADSSPLPLPAASDFLKASFSSGRLHRNGCLEGHVEIVDASRNTSLSLLTRSSTIVAAMSKSTNSMSPGSVCSTAMAHRR